LGKLEFGELVRWANKYWANWPLGELYWAKDHISKLPLQLSTHKCAGLSEKSDVVVGPVEE